MKRSVKLVIILVMSVVAFCSLSGFMYDGPHFKICITDKNGKYVDENRYENHIFDLLIKFDESDEWYTDFNELETKIPKDSELANYCEDGYRSLRVHFRDTVSSNTAINISDEWGRDGSYNGNQRHALFCHRYKKLRLVAADESGNIITITEPVKIEDKFINMAHAYLNYCPEDNTISTGYVTSSIAQSYMHWLLIILVFFDGWALVLLLIYSFVRKKTSKLCRVFKILSSLFFIPFVILSVCCVLPPQINPRGITDILEEIVKIVFSLGCLLCTSLVSIIVLHFFSKELKARENDNCITDLK